MAPTVVALIVEVVGAVTKLKSSEKLPRGEHLVVRMGDQFFAGDKLLPQKVTQRARWTWGKETEPEKEIIVGWIPTMIFTDEVQKAKKFRRLSQANAACERLNRRYSGISKATVERHRSK